MIPLAALAVFSGLSLNLLLSFALGAAGAVKDTLPKGVTRRQAPFFQLGVLFLSVLFLWVVLTYLIPSAWRGFFEYFLFFPLSAVACMGFELLGERLIPKILPAWAAKPESVVRIYSALTAYDGLALISLIITFALAGGFAGAAVLALFFALGNLTATLVLNEIRRRAALEWVPRYIRGSPLILISMGLLSLISASAAVICFRMLEAF
jgi:electron transport complex protein RnfA